MKKGEIGTYRVKDIFSVPCAVRISGEKAISIIEHCGTQWAYVQYADGMRTYFKGRHSDFWELVSTQICTNY